MSLTNNMKNFEIDCEKFTPEISLGEFIAKRRIELGYEKVEFSKLVGVYIDSVRNWEKDESKPVGKNMVALIKLLKFKKSEVMKYFGNDFYGTPD